MTTEPILEGGPFPDAVTCPLHAKALSEIKAIVLDTRKQVIKLKEIGGPLAEHEKSIEASFSSSRRAHERIDAVEVIQTSSNAEIEAIKKEQNKLLVRIGAIMTPISAAIGGLIGAVVARMQ